MNKYEEFVIRLSDGTTCKPHVEFIEKYRGYIIYHHKSHIEWLDRGYGNITCKAYFQYVKFNPDASIIAKDDLFFQKECRFYLRKSKKNIDYIKTIIDKESIQK